MSRARLLLFAGDGIGPEIMAEGARLLEALRSEGLDIEWEEELLGGASIDKHGVPLTDAALKKAGEADAVLMGAVGGAKWDTLPFDVRPERGLLGLRKGLDLFANLRPALCFAALSASSSLREEVVAGLDIVIVRELTGGVYFGEPRGIEDLGNGERRGVNTQVYTTSEIRRIGDVAFGLARGRGGRLCSVEKANVMESGVLWREEITKLGEERFSDIELTHMYADNCAMQLVKNPKQFDVIVTDNLFGDILSDCAAMLTGSLGMLPSASLGETRPDGGRAAVYEPVHGSAPDIAGRGVANPLALLLSLAMLLRWSLGEDGRARRLEAAVERVLSAGLRTPDLVSGDGEGVRVVGTKEMGAAVLKEFSV